MFAKRPSKRETEEDLLQLQEDFLKSKQQPNVVTQTPSNVIPIPQPPIPAPILHPQVPKKKSIFGMEMEKKKKKKAQEMKEAENVQLASSSSNSFIIDCTGLGDPAEVQNLHRENVNFIRSHTKEEIAELIKELQHLKPMIDVIKAKKKAAKSTAEEIKAPETPTPNELSEPALPKEEMPIDLEQAKTWLHMGTVEMNKMAWMAQLPEAKELHRSNNNAEARFDFNGMLLAPDAEIPVQAALHHHGTEPERAGYSFPDLFLLSQSAFPTQKQIALNVFSNILKNYWKGCYDGCFNESLLTTLLDSGLMIVLRCALDNTNLFVVSAAIAALRNLLYSEADEACLDRLFFWEGGSLPFYLFPDSLPRDKEEAEKLKDHEVVQRDAIVGVLRMDLLPRLSYLLQTITFDASELIWIVEVLIRVSRHSLSSAAQIYDCSGLMSHLISNFLPSHWGQAKTIGDKLAQPYNIPLPHVLKLLRVIAMAGPNMAARMLTSYPDFVASLKVYLALETDDRKIPDTLSMMIQVESHRLWQVLATHGLAHTLVKELRPLIVTQLRQTLCVPLPSKPRSFKVEYGAALMGVLEASFLHPDCQEEAELYKTLVQDLAQKWLWQLTQETDPISTPSLALAGRCLSLLTTLHALIIRNPQADSTEAIEILKNFLSGFIIPFLKSRKFSEMMEVLGSRSLLLSKVRCRKDPISLPSISSILLKEDAVPLLLEGSPVPLLLSLFASLRKLYFLHKTLLAPSVLLVMNHPQVCYYTKKITKTKGSDSFYNYMELELLKNLCQMSALTCVNPNSNLYHDLALHLPFLAYKSRCPSSYFLPQDIFNASSLSKDLAGEMASLLKLYPEMYQEMAYWPPRPNNWCLWPFMPILDLWKQSRQKNLSKSPETSRLLGVCLSWISHLMDQHPEVMRRIPMPILYCLLSLVYLIDEKILQPLLRSSLTACHTHLVQVDLSKVEQYLAKYPSISVTNFHQLYSELLDNYLNVSYMNDILALHIYLALPTSLEARKLLLQPNHLTEVLRYFCLPLNHIGIPLERFLQPPEIDLEMLWRYMDLLSRKEATKENCPLLLLMALHHLHNHLAGECPSPKLRSSAAKLPAFNLHLLTHYIPSSPPGFILSDTPNLTLPSVF